MVFIRALVQSGIRGWWWVVEFMSYGTALGYGGERAHGYVVPWSRVAGRP